MEVEGREWRGKDSGSKEVLKRGEDAESKGALILVHHTQRSWEFCGGPDERDWRYGQAGLWVTMVYQQYNAGWIAVWQYCNAADSVPLSRPRA